jgi:molecular chaperone GrpE
MTVEDTSSAPDNQHQDELNQEFSSSSADASSDSANATRTGSLESGALKLEHELAEMKDRYLRLMADFENFKKRALKEQSELLKYQGERVLVDLLEVVDNLELALTYSSAEYDKLKQGLDMVLKMFVERLERWEVRGESSMGKQFDPHKHAAISRVPGNSTKPGTIVGELKKTYFYKDKLIRVGEVVVAAEGDGVGA